MAAVDATQVDDTGVITSAMFGGAIPLKKSLMEAVDAATHGWTHAALDAAVMATEWYVLQVTWSSDQVGELLYYKTLRHCMVRDAAAFRWVWERSSQSDKRRPTRCSCRWTPRKMSRRPTVVTGGCRANSSEKIRLRCLDPRCKLRPRGTEAEWGEEEEDVNPDDKDVAEEQLFEEDVDDEEFLHDEEMAAPSDSPSKARSSGLHKRNVFPFAHPESFYKRLLRARPD
jgi:hypothetical protein